MKCLPVDIFDEATAEIEVDQTRDRVLVAADATGLPSPADLLVWAVIKVVERFEHRKRRSLELTCDETGARWVGWGAIELMQISKRENETGQSQDLQDGRRGSGSSQRRLQSLV